MSCTSVLLGRGIYAKPSEAESADGNDSAVECRDLVVSIVGLGPQLPAAYDKNLPYELRGSYENKSV